ncbi:Crp/Fnr family transcriptional regulator [Rubrivivax gelatinosus]|uniref:Crp/Fnr family transcriptional regulator n=1 Tax=Rubrivivax gelatinosus TaxID=28068 RepID=UPI001E6298A9|nr:Crp/Fnr family transcriptional regulator [Rubrivivax gelatinosus]
MPRRLARGQVLCAPGDGRNLVFFVASGRLRVHLAGTNRELTLAFLEPGDVYSTHSPAWVTAAAASTVWTIDTRAFLQRLSDDPALLPPVMAVLGRLLTGAVGLVEDLAFREVPSRLARFVLGLAQRRGERSGEALLLPLDLSFEDIASLLGSTRQTVSALVSQWQREGLLERRGRRCLRIPSAQALQALEAIAGRREPGEASPGRRTAAAPRAHSASCPSTRSRLP